MRYSERSHEKRIGYLRTLRQVIKDKGSESIVYLDESGFERTTFNPIEQDFAIMKRRRQFLPADTTIDEVVRSYVNSLD